MGTGSCPLFKPAGPAGGQLGDGAPAARTKSAALGEAGRGGRGAKASTRSSTRAMQAKGPKISKASGGEPAAYRRGFPRGEGAELGGNFLGPFGFRGGFGVSDLLEEKLIRAPGLHGHFSGLVDQKPWYVSCLEHFSEKC